MGIGGNFIEILGSLRRRGYLRTPSAVVEIGAQQLANSFLEAQPAVDALGDLFGIDRRFPLPAPQISQVVHGTLEHLNSAAPMARGFYEWLGFRYACIDIDGSPGSIALDLNYDITPLNETGSYQLVTNFGTTEHVANQLNAFKIIHELCAPGGLMNSRCSYSGDVQSWPCQLQSQILLDACAQQQLSVSAYGVCGK